MVKQRRYTYLIYFIACLLAVTTLLPFFWTLSGSFKTDVEIAKIPPTLFPDAPTLKNFAHVFNSTSFFTYFTNTLIYAVTVTVFSLLINSMSAYALARLNFPGKKFMFIMILSTMMVPFAVVMIPLFLITKAFGWIDSLTGLIVPNLFSAFGIFLLRQFYMGLPRELEEAGKMDGMSLLGVYLRIVLPLSKPILSALAVFTFLSCWNNYLWPLIVISSEKSWVLTLGIASMASEYSANWNLIMAGSIIGLIPTLLIFIFLQKQLVEGVKLSGIK